MLLNISNLHKTIGQKELFADLDMRVEDNEKVALIGRNGMGKTTLFKLINGEDKDFTGDVQTRKNLRIILTRQEHNHTNGINALEYILNDVPGFTELNAIIKHGHENLSEDLDEIQKYTDAITEFSNLGFYQIEDKILSTLEDFGINFEQSLDDFSKLSGGQKRFVEITRIMYSEADLALLDEPTNHMDYLGKEAFIKWMRETKINLFIVTHDRDVLKYVDRILELKDKKILNFNGNYDNYLKQNSVSTVTSITMYENSLKKLDHLKKQINEAAKKKSYGGAPKILYDKLTKEYAELKEELSKPSFWIDQDSKDLMSKKVIEKYEKYKEKNVQIGSTDKNKEHKRVLISASNFSVGYEFPLFKNVNFSLEHGDKLFIKGRNGAGKSTLVRTLIRELSLSQNKPNEFPSKIFSGEVKFSEHIRLGIYEQEIDKKYLPFKLKDAVLDVYHHYKIDTNEQKVKNILGQYLFNPVTDADLEINQLSGGQKARFQIIKMLCNNPNLLILDEPTNHLDLPSIEELENALINYHGAIIYITHDNYLVNKLEGEVIGI